MNNIVLIGFMGSGKSTLATKLSQSLKLQLIESDEFISAYCRMSINDIFKFYGEAHFRLLEKIFIDLHSCVKNKIISTGGGMCIFNDVKNLGNVIYLKCDFEIILERLRHDRNRPLWNQDVENFKNLYDYREKIYENTANFIIDSNKNIDEIKKDVMNIIKK